MRVGLWLRETDPRAGGGFTFEHAVLRALLDQADSAHELVVLAPGSAADVSRIWGAEAIGLPASRWGRLWHLRRPRLSALRLVAGRAHVPRAADRVVREAQLDFLWCLGPIALSREVPYAVTVWDLQHRAQPWFPEVSAEGRWKIREAAHAAALERAAIVVVGTEVARRQVVEWYGVDSSRVRVLPMPVPAIPSPTSEATAAVLHRLDLREHGYLLYPAQFWAHKNHVTLLRGLASLARDGLAPVLVCTGADQGNLAHVRQVAEELGIGHLLRTPGFVSPEELTALYAGARALAFPSAFGPDNLPPLEAFSVGCPVVAGAVEGALEQLGDAALLVDIFDADAWADALRRVCTDEVLRDRLIARGRARAAAGSPREYATAISRALDDFAPVRALWPSGRQA